MRIVSKILCFAFCVWPFLRLSAQAPGQANFDYSSKSPTVQQMQRAVDVPVSYFTGSVGLTIPVYTVSAKGISLPVSISYQPGGIKVDDESGIAGLGWTLNAGGSVTRVVRGNPDEGIKKSIGPSLRHPLPWNPNFKRWENTLDSIAYSRNLEGGLAVDGSTGVDQLAFSTHNQAVRDDVHNASSWDSWTAPAAVLGLGDTEPDVFYYNFGGYSGKFVLDIQGNPLQIPYNQDIRITTRITYGLDTSIRGVGVALDTTVYRYNYFQDFVISTPDGKDYYFGTNSNSRIRSRPLSREYFSYNAWQLSKVVDRATKDSIVIVYDVPTYALHGRTPSSRFLKQADVDNCDNMPGNESASNQPNLVAYPKYVRSTKEELEFFYSGKQIDSIILKNRYTNDNVQKFQFDYTSFLTGRRKLFGFTTKDLKRNEFYPYTFSYYDIGGIGTNAQDYWGYYNGRPNSSLAPGYLSCPGANRKASWPAMQQDVLTGMSTPTGGITKFEYEPHSAYAGRSVTGSIAESDAVVFGPFTNFTVVDTIGGLRIKSIVNYDPVSRDTLYKRFYYQLASGNSSGFLHAPPSMVIDVSSFVCNTGNTSSSPRYYVSTRNTFEGNGSASHVTYRMVTVQDEKNGQSNGRVEYEYYDDNNTDSIFYSNALTATSNAPLVGAQDVTTPWLQAMLPFNYLSGMEKERRVFNAAGDLQVREKTSYTARLYPNVARGAKFTSISKIDACAPLTANKITTPALEQSLHTEMYSSFVNQDSIMQEEIKIAMNAWSQEEKRKREEDMRVDNVKYGGGFQPPPPILPPPQTFYFFNRYMIRKIGVVPYQKIVEQYASPTSVQTDTVTHFYTNSSHLNPTSVETRSSKNELLKTETYYAFDYEDVNNGDSSMYFLKRGFSNPPIAAFSYRNGLVTSGAYSTFRIRSRFDSTSMLPYQSHQMYTSPDGITPASLNLGTSGLQQLNYPQNKFQLVATYKYNPDATLSYAVKKSDEKVSLLWDYSGERLTAQVLNADSADIAYTSFETSNDGRWIVAGSARQSGSGVTGTKSYNLTNGSITKSGLNTGKNYIVSYWSSSGAANVNGVTATAGPVKNGWQYFQHIVNAAASISVSGSSLIDELRLYPANSQITSYVYDPFYGPTAATAANGLTEYYEYDNMGRLVTVRDADRKVKQVADYAQAVSYSDTAMWRSANGNVRLEQCPANSAFISGNVQNEQIDINPNSPTYRTLRWYTVGVKDTVIASWEYTATAPRCVQVSGQNTGVQEREQRDMNPCSPTYNTTKWVGSTNTTACPLPCTGPDKKIVNGVCQTGVKIYTTSGYSSSLGMWVCQFYYQWTDCTHSATYTENLTFQPQPGTPCTPD